MLTTNSSCQDPITSTKNSKNNDIIYTVMVTTMQYAIYKFSQKIPTDTDLNGSTHANVEHVKHREQYHVAYM